MPPNPQPTSRIRRALRVVLAAFYLIGGIGHLIIPDKFIAIMPDAVPFPREVIFITGLCEIAGAIGLLTKRWRWWAGVALAAYAICVFPANLKHAFADVVVPPLPESWWYHGPRLLLQPVLVWWALFAGGAVDWPFKRQTPRTEPHQKRGGAQGDKG